MNLTHLYVSGCVSALLALLGNASAADDRGEVVLSSKQLGFEEIDTTLTFTRESERTYKVQFSNDPPYADLGALYSMFYVCASRRVAVELGFDRYGIVPDPKPGKGGTAVFLREGESASQALASQYANASLLPVDYPTIAAGCDMKASKAKR
jgi:hypothetical protein